MIHRPWPPRVPAGGGSRPARGSFIRPASLTSHTISVSSCQIRRMPGPPACRTGLAGASPTASTRATTRCGASPAAPARSRTRWRSGDRSRWNGTDSAVAGAAVNGSPKPGARATSVTFSPPSGQPGRVRVAPRGPPARTGRASVAAGPPGWAPLVLVVAALVVTALVVTALRVSVLVVLVVAAAGWHPALPDGPGPDPVQQRADGEPDDQVARGGGDLLRDRGRGAEREQHHEQRDQGHDPGEERHRPGGRSQQQVGQP